MKTKMMEMNTNRPNSSVKKMKRIWATILVTKKKKSLKIRRLWLELVEIEVRKAKELQLSN